MFKCLKNLFFPKPSPPPAPKPLKLPEPPLSREVLRLFCWVEYRVRLENGTLEKMLEQLNKHNLEDLARRIYGVELDKRYSQRNMVIQLKTIYGDKI